MPKNERLRLLSLVIMIGVIGVFALMGGKPLENQIEISSQEPEVEVRPIPELLKEIKNNPTRSPASATLPN